MSFRTHASNVTRIANRFTRKGDYEGQKAVIVPEDEASEMYYQLVDIAKVLHDLADDEESS